MNVRRGLISLLTSALLIGVTSCAAFPSRGLAQPTHSFTGLAGDDGPVLAVKIDDTNPAHPQVGIDKADVVYVEQVEAGLTRILAIFSSTIPDLIGPIRSVRISDIDLLSQYGKVGFAYSGAQSKMRPVVKAANLIDLGAERNPPTIYTRDPQRPSPVDMILRAPELMAKAKTRYGSEIVSSHFMGWKFGKKPSGGIPVSSITIHWPNAQYEARWSASERRWLLSHNGHADIDTSGKQLGSPTLVIQKVLITPSSYGDKFGGVTPLSQTVGSGSGYLLRDGEIFTLTWQRSTPDVPTTWRIDGSDASFSPGQIWFMLTDREPTIRAIEQATPEASPTKSK